jgi:hypothetical protein
MLATADRKETRTNCAATRLENRCFARIVANLPQT